MAEVLYADSNRNTKELADKLRSEGIGVECIDNEIRGGEKMTATGIFHKRFTLANHPDELDYKVLIAHLGVGFQGVSKYLVEDHPTLNIVMVSDFEAYGLMRTMCGFEHERILGCDYDSEELIPFVKKALQE
jgi:hypothetical protein